MRKIFAFFMTTADGYYEGLNQEIDWHNADDEFSVFAIEQLREADTMVFGRRTYDLMASYWPTPAAIEGSPTIAGLMNDLPKFVVSRSLAQADWKDTQVVKGDAVAHLRELKQQPGKDIVIMGSSDLTAGLLPSGVVDEVRIMVNPVVLGTGRSLFDTAGRRVGLELLRTRPFKSGNVLLTYRPVAD